MHNLFEYCNSFCMMHKVLLQNVFKKHLFCSFKSNSQIEEVEVKGTIYREILYYPYQHIYIFLKLTFINLYCNIHIHFSCLCITVRKYFTLSAPRQTFFFFFSFLVFPLLFIKYILKQQLFLI